MMTEDYNEYIQSDVWNKKRASVLEKNGKVCSKCGRTFNLQVHHKNYDKEFGFEDMTDLMVVCQDCHNELHQDLDLFDNPEMAKRCTECNQEMIELKDSLKCFKCGIEIFKNESNRKNLYF